MSIAKKMIANNIKKYIDAKGVKHTWVMERIDVSKPTFYKLIKGDGNVDQFEEKILNLFRIKDPFYFHQIELQLPKTVEMINEEKNFMDYAALSYHGEENDEFTKGMEVFRGFVELIDILHAVSQGENDD